MANTLNLGNGNWATKEDSLLAYNSENGNYKPLPFDFTRASSATVVNKAGLIETVGSGEPRIDFSNDAKGALLLEPSRSNLVKSTGDISTQSTYWVSNQGGTSIQNATTSPDGLNTASQINTFGQQYGGITQGSISVSNTEYTYSIYLKAKNGTPNIRLIFLDGATFHSSDFTISSEWKRYDYKFTPVSGSFQIYITCPNVEASFYTWGVQLEQGSYATSYIPTQGSAVTRVADASSQTVPSGVIGQTEGTMFIDGIINGKNSSVNRRIFTISNGTSSTAINIQTPAQNSKLEFEVTNGGATQVFISADNNSLVYGQNFKAAFAYKSNDFVAYINGVQIGTDTNGTVPTCEKVSFDRGNNTSNFEGSVNQTKLYNTRLSNAELAALTKI